jgi:hypothetical protein
VDEKGNVFLIDWTLAQGLPAPYSEIGNFAAWTRERPYLNAFLEGYGITKERWNFIKADVDRVTLATLLGGTVWSKKEAPQKLNEMVGRVRKLVAEILQTGKPPVP